ncbi:GTP-binding protein [Eubacteriaceae bacterium ES2]|nr:GTP-binding protein [Eubacteriaceae bacterium ES2]
MTKIDMITGFLGAGKTTLIKKLIAKNPTNEKIVLIENEFGDVNIDSQFLSDTELEITELTAGCICCTLLGDFSRALKKIMAEIGPDRIIVEPSGVARATDLLKGLQIADIPDLQINSISNVVDASVCTEYLEAFGDFYQDQISHAGCILMSHTDDCDPTELQAAVTAVKNVNPLAIIVTTPWTQLSSSQIYQGINSGKDARGQIIDTLLASHLNPGSHHHDHDHSHSPLPAPDVFTTVSYETVRTFSEPELDALLKNLDQCQGKVLRAKGVVKDHADGWLYFDYVPGKQEIRKGMPALTGMICVIGQDLNMTELENFF